MLALGGSGWASNKKFEYLGREEFWTRPAAVLDSSDEGNNTIRTSYTFNILGGGWLHEVAYF